MTISKKLILALPLIFGIHTAVQAQANIDTPHCSEDTPKTAIFSQKIDQEKQKQHCLTREEQQQQKFNKVCDTLCLLTIVMGFIGLTMFAIIQETKNPRPIVYMYPPEKPTMSVTYTKRYPQICNPRVYDPCDYYEFCR